MHSDDQSQLTAECVVFTRYLLRVRPDPYVIRKYAEAHQVLPALGRATRFDRCLLAVARIHPICTRWADAYARVFDEDSTLRRKLVLTLAILETSPKTFRLIDRPPGGSRPVLFWRLAIAICAAAASLLIGTVLFLPIRLAVGDTSRVAR